MTKSESFYNLETIGGTLLFISAVAAIILANSPWHALYQAIFNTPISIGVANHLLKQPVIHWVNDGLMAIYFLLIGLEIKREMNRGVLSSPSAVFIPAITALCGLMLPACIYIAFNYSNPLYLQGWAIPTATDIAFSLGIVALLGSRIPLALKIVLTAIAIFDDMGAIGIIAVFYTKTLSLQALTLAGFCTLILVAFNYFQCRRLSIYILVGIVLWLAVLKSGVHATLAGIVLAMTIPDPDTHSPLSVLETGLHPWVVFVILPIFAFANAGFNFHFLSLSMLWHPIVLGVGIGLIIGKQIGIFLPLYYFVHYKNFLKKDGISNTQIYGLALICGVGFTMSLFIGTLAFQHDGFDLMSLVKLGVMLGSLTAGTLGFLLLKFTHPKLATS